MNALIRFKNVAPLFVIALSLVTAAATTTDVIFSFDEDDGEYADTDLETDSAGNIYGTTVLGGDHGSGTVFQLSPTPNGWVQNVLYSFTGGADGGEPYKGVSIDRQGNLYGTAVTGGSGSCEGGCGVVYKLTNSGGTWTQTCYLCVHGRRRWIWPGRESHCRWERKCVWHDSHWRHIRRRHDLQTSSTRRQLDVSGHSHFYWRCRRFQWFGWKNVAEPGTALWRSDYGRTLWSRSCFQTHTNSRWRMGFQDALFFPRPTRRKLSLWRIAPALLRVNVYGTTYYGGANGIGAVYELVPRPTGEWNERVIYSFQNGSDGNSPISNLVRDAAGNLYGTTSEGGLGSGTIFKLSSQWRRSVEPRTVVHAFDGPPDGGFSYNGMVVDPFGNFYGATVHGGDDDDGCVYHFTP